MKKNKNKSKSHETNHAIKEDCNSANKHIKENKILYVVGRHEVLEALKSDDLPETIFLSSSAQGSIIREIRKLAKEKVVKISVLKDQIFKKKFGSKNQGVVAQTGIYKYKRIEDLLKTLKNTEPTEKTVLVALNHVEDCRNLGAIIRTTEAAGAKGLILPLQRSAYVNEWAIKTAQGAHNWLTIVRVENLVNTLKQLKQEYNFRIYGLCEKGIRNYKEVKYINRCILVVGGENAGLGKEIPKLCDELIKISLRGKTPSLNVSVAMGIALFEIMESLEFEGNV